MEEVTFESLALIGRPEACLVRWCGRAVGQFALWIDDVVISHGKRPTFHVATIEAAEAYFKDFYAKRLY